MSHSGKAEQSAHLFTAQSQSIAVVDIAWEFHFEPKIYRSIEWKNTLKKLEKVEESMQAHGASKQGIITSFFLKSYTMML